MSKGGEYVKNRCRNGFTAAVSPGYLGSLFLFLARGHFWERDKKDCLLIEAANPPHMPERLQLIILDRMAELVRIVGYEFAVDQVNTSPIAPIEDDRAITLYTDPLASDCKS